MGQQEPSERKKLIQEYYNKDHFVRQFEDRQKILKKPRRKRQHYQVDDSDDTPFNCCGDEDAVKKLYQHATDILNHASELNELLVVADGNGDELSTNYMPESNTRSVVADDNGEELSTNHTLESDTRSHVADERVGADDENTTDEIITPIIQTNSKKHKKLKTLEKRYARDLEKHPILLPCVTRGHDSKKGCNKDCVSKFSEEDGTNIHSEFWCITYDERLSWLGAAISVHSPVRPLGKTHGKHEKDTTRSYSFSSITGEKIVVCQAFFLSTLGLSSDQMTMLKKKKGMYIKVTPDQRGHHEPKHKLQASVSEAIENHIKSYGPSISHYRRKHAPNKLYLSPEFTVSSMFNDFNERHPEHEIHYSTYYRALRAMKISVCQTL